MEPQVANAPSFYLYVLECADGTWYTGYTVDVAERVRAHNAGAGAKYAEYRFKRLTRRQKERLVRRAAREPFEQVLRALMPAADAGEASA